MRKISLLSGSMCLVLGLLIARAGVCGEDAYIRRAGNRWTIGTKAVERTIVLEDGKFLLKSFKNKLTSTELIRSVPGDEFSFTSGDGQKITGSTGGWKLVGSVQQKLALGESELDITLEKDSLQVTKSYVVYPKSSIIREWVTFKNAEDTPVKVIEPGFLDMNAMLGDPASIDFNWMTGGECCPGTWELRTEKLSAGKPRTFDSYEPFPLISKQDAAADGVNVKVMLNDDQIWPKSGWQYSPDATVTLPFDLEADVMAGDRLSFVVNMNKHVNCDTTTFDPTIAYSDGESHTASREFSETQGKNGWKYEYIENAQFHDMGYYSESGQWLPSRETPGGIPFITPSTLHPSDVQDAVRTWIASKPGHVKITGTACNTGNGSASTSYGFRYGSGSYAPWYSLYDTRSKVGLFIGWDYFGHWTSSFALGEGGFVNAQLKVAGHKQILNPGDSFSTPKSFIGVYTDDLDNAGNECLDWQYRYMWDYTRNGWFPAIRMLGYWWNGTPWVAPHVVDQPSLYRKIFRVADLMRYVGADVYHRDYGWWDLPGDWNGPDFRSTGEYLRKYDMGQLIYAFIYDVELSSKVAREHPDWVVKNNMDLSKPEVVEHLKWQLDDFVRRWGAFEWRNDGTFTIPVNDDDTPLLKQDQGFREILRSFLDKHPDCAFHAVNGGGLYGGYEYTRMCSSFSFSDGADGLIRNYYASLLFPPDKTSDIPDAWNPDKYDKSTWRGLLCINFDMTGDTLDPSKLEGIRELIDTYHYLHKEGVVGRWVKVYRPIIRGDDCAMYFQRLSGDRKRGIIIPKRIAPGPVTIIPKGLLPRERYLVSYHELQAQENRTGADLMTSGIIIDKMSPGELIYLNLPMHPGSKLDKTPPAPPSGVTKSTASNMGFPGVELRWKPGTDNNWVSYYEIIRNGKSVDKLAKGVFYFDHSAGADLAATYEIRTVDGAGNKSGEAVAQGPGGLSANVYDDAGEDILFTGTWNRKRNLLPAHEGTISVSGQAGDSAEITFEGSTVLWFSKLGADCGNASVSIDASEPEIVDTYSADGIWGVCVYQKRFLAPGKHTLKIQVTGGHNPWAKAGNVQVDAIRVEK